MTILTSIKGNNSVLFEQVFALYGKGKTNLLDLTYGKGIFWKDITLPTHATLEKNDILLERGNTHFDFRDLPGEWANKFDFVVFDPPYMHSQKYGTVKKSISAVYRNETLATSGMNSVRESYKLGMTNAYKTLQENGILVVKCMDSIESGKQKRLHIWVWQDAIDMGFADEDLFVLTTNSTPTMRWQHQLHAHKNNSFLWVFRKNSTKGRL